MFVLKIKTDNAAFGEQDSEEMTDDCRNEVARILKDVARKLESGKDCGAIQDINGNTVGDYSF